MLAVLHEWPQRLADCYVLWKNGDGVMLKIAWFPCTVQQLNPNQCTKSIQIVANQ